MYARQKVARKRFIVPKKELINRHDIGTHRQHWPSSSQSVARLWMLIPKKTRLISLLFMQSVVQFVVLDL